MQYHSGLVTSGPYSLDDGPVGVNQIDEEVAGIALLPVGMDVRFATLAVANTQEADGARMGQLGGGPRPLSGKRPSGLKVK